MDNFDLLQAKNTLLLMVMTNFNKRWHTPLDVFKHYQKLVADVGFEGIEKKPEYQRVRDARSAAYFALVQSRMKEKPTFLRIPKQDPPDAYIMQPSPPDFDAAPVECTEYKSGSTETLLDQLIRSKKLSSKYSQEYCLLISIYENIDEQYKAVHEYASTNHVPFTIATLQVVQWSPDTIVRVVLLHPFFSQEHTINVGEEAFHFREKYGVPNTVISKRAGSLERVRTQKSETVITVAPWEDLED